jgi:hypothetical protein
MRTLIVIMLLSLAIAACTKREVITSGGSDSPVVTRVTPSPVKGRLNAVIRPDVPSFIEKSLLGSKLAANGNVETEEATFTAGSPVSLTLRFRESPSGLQAGARWYTTDRKPFAHEERPMNGGKVVTFTLKSKLKPGRYRAEGYWGGNLAADKKFEVVSKKK